MNSWTIIILLMVYNVLLTSIQSAPTAVMSTTFEPTFYGDIPLERYIEQTVCSVQQQSNRKWSFVYVHQLMISENFKIKALNFSKPLKPDHFQCFSAVYLSQINASQLSSNLNSLHFQYSEILTVINVQQSSSALLAQTLTTLNSLYIECSRCLPFLLLFPSTFHLSSVKRALPFAQLNSTFPLRAVLSFSSHPSAPKLAVVLHLNPVLDGCAQFTGLFAPESNADFSRLISKQCHLNNSYLIASVNEDQPYCQVLVKNETEVSFGSDYSADVDLLAMLQRKYHFRIRLKYAYHSYSPRWNASKREWVGIVGHVFSGAAQLGFCGLSTPRSRRKFVDFTVFTGMDSYAPLTRYPGLKSRQWLSVEPFSGAVWLLVAATFAFLVVILTRTFQKKDFSFFASVETLYRILLKSSTNLIKARLAAPAQWLLAAWILACLVLSNSYSGLFFSLLTLPQTEPPIDTVEQLLEYITANRKLELICSSYSEELILGANPENELLYRIAQRFKRTPIRKFTTKDELMVRLKEGVLPGRAVLFTSRVYVASMRENYGLAIGHHGRESLNLESIALALPKRSPLLRPFNLVIRTLHERGLIELFLRRSLRRKVVYRSESEEVLRFVRRQQQQLELIQEAQSSLSRKYKSTPLSLVDLQSVFVLAALGISASVASFLVETIFLRCFLFYTNR